MMSESQNFSSLPTCSVVCLTYNHARFSAAAIESIAQQTYPNIEIIVVDDGSTDGNDEIVDIALKTSGLPYKFIRQKNTGKIAANLNRGLQATTGDYVSMFSLDDILLPDCIASKMETLAVDPNLAFVVNSCHSVVNDDGQVIQPLCKFNLYGLDVTTPDELLEIEFQKIGAFFMQGGVFRSDVINEIGGYDEDLQGDDLIIRTKIFRYMQRHSELSFKIVHEPQFKYRTHNNNIHADRWRQVDLILEWRNRYFPDRRMPSVWCGLVRDSLRIAFEENDFATIKRAKSLNPEVMEILVESGRLWNYRWGALKQAFSLR
ncbi:glycosyltransferase [uncultured Ruegeria sp.]|uniref:glycosyltransferase n=1 Tax=uncultured Ruegeria sp. TaxID=259304 RepID=UPI00261D80D9|nr:glycosyltransferase [uncultured Ruegeria sp.]